MSLKPFGQFVERLRQIATENPDTTAECRYFDFDGQSPVCIVGHGFAELGVKPDPDDPDSRLIGPTGEFVCATGDTVADCVNWKAAGLREPGSRQAMWIMELQSLQDSHESWGDSLCLADKYVADNA